MTAETPTEARAVMSCPPVAEAEVVAEVVEATEVWIMATMVAPFVVTLLSTLKEIIVVI
jgi:hypothetical protein